MLGHCCCVQKSEGEQVREVKGPRANNYGVDSNAPPDNPSKCVHMLDVEDLEVCPSCCHTDLHVT